MVNVRDNSLSKVTIQIPTYLKNDVSLLKDSLGISMNSIYKEAIIEYIEKKKQEQLQKEALEMLDEYKSNPEIIELMEFVEDIDEE